MEGPIAAARPLRRNGLRPHTVDTTPDPQAPDGAASARLARDAGRRVIASAWITAAVSALALGATSLIAGAPIFAPSLTGDGIAPWQPAGLLVCVLVGLLAACAGTTRYTVRVMAGGSLVALVAASPFVDAGQGDLLQALAFAAAMGPLGRLGQLVASRLAPARPERVVIVGSGDVAQRAAAALRATGADLLGKVDDDPLPGDAGIHTLGGTSDLAELIARRGVDRVVVAFSSAPDARIVSALRECDALGIPVTVVPRLFDLLPIGARVGAIGNVATLEIPPTRRSRAAAVAKRALDVVGAGTLLILAAPVMALTALAIAIDDGRPVLFRQRRVGRGGRAFEVLKFRTMVRNADALGDARIAALQDGSMQLADAVAALKQADDPRVTRIGRILRRTSLDELPQLVNVLRGEMSLVGPRPLRDFEVDRLSGWERARNDVQPGVTGLWQVSGRSEVAWGERMQLDYRYVRHWSLGEDVRILLRTVPAVLDRRGAV